MQTGSAEGKEPLTIETNLSHDLVSENGGGVVNVIDNEEILHGDWLVVRRKKRGGKDKEKDKVAQSVGKNVMPNPKKHVKSQFPQSVGSPNLLTFPSTSTSMGLARGKAIDNFKKRARKENPHVQHGNKEGSMPMQYTSSAHVQLSNELQGDSGKGMSQLASDTVNEKNRVIRRSATPMEGFDLRVGIQISDNLTRGSSLILGAGKILKGKPPDGSGVKGTSKPVVKIMTHKHVGMDLERGVQANKIMEDTNLAVSQMILDSGQ
ncbi:hypothetical protein RIF29_11532 [Crotalaria pallida]|uniref:Uncharacterized protein n=1 Tax=Crotalaria pallida TaxID=3830 RepID=A0AAN9IM71_CROPI